MLGMPKEKGEEGLSAYELKRLENIRQNQAILASLNIPKPGAFTAAESASKVATKPKSAKKAAKRKSLKPVIPTRASARLRIREEEIFSGKRSKASAKLEPLLTELPQAPAKPPRPRAPTTTKIPFEPEIGATQHFLKIMKEASSTHIKAEKALPNAARQMLIKGEAGVVKIVQERIYSIALHPSCDKILVATGSKAGAIGFWDATEAFHEPTPQPSPPVSFLFHPHQDSVSTLRYNPSDCNQLLSCAYDGVVQCMDIVKGHFDPVVWRDEDSEPYLSSFDFLDETGWSLCVADMSGTLSMLDRREARKPDTFKLHLKKIGGVTVSRPDSQLIATCSLDNTVCVWDRRMLKRGSPNDLQVSSRPLVKLEHRRAVTAVHFHPGIRDCLVSTCYDDNLRIHADIFDSAIKTMAIPHNNQTGRWITTFKAFWDPKSNSDLKRSTVIVGDMNRGLDLVDGLTGVTHNYTSQWLTAQPAVNGAHPFLDLVVSGNATGKLALWTPSTEPSFDIDNYLH